MNSSNKDLIWSYSEASSMEYTLDTMKAGDEIISMHWRKQRAMGRYSHKLHLTHPNHLNKQGNYGVLAIYRKLQDKWPLFLKPYLIQSNCLSEASIRDRFWSPCCHFNKNGPVWQCQTLKSTLPHDTTLNFLQKPDILWWQQSKSEKLW